MPSDPRVAQALDALAQPIAEFRAAVEGALNQAAEFLDAHHASPEVRAARAAVGLGAFAEGRVDPARFAALFPPVGRGDEESLAALELAVHALRTVVERGDSLFVAQVTNGTKLGATVDAALSDAGRAFGAIVLAELVRAGRYVRAEHDRLLDAVEFHEWNRVERRFAPPLVVRLEGADLHPGALMDFADGRAKIILVVSGPCAPAPLARCITPGTLVIQTDDGSGLDLVASFDGPAIVAMVPEGCATFTHDPRRGTEGWKRLSIGRMPEVPKKPIGGVSAWQMAQDLYLLTDHARTPFTVPARDGTAAPAIGSADAVDRVTQWLLGQTGLPGGA
ncbi:MAG: hypothetical protein OEW77_08920 [Gemmatimonadota bacterium]|nr:hypothetical protein [Gemmatimonadota bacterium]